LKPISDIFERFLSKTNVKIFQNNYFNLLIINFESYLVCYIINDDYSVSTSVVAWSNCAESLCEKKKIKFNTVLTLKNFKKYLVLLCPTLNFNKKLIIKLFILK
jgi:hypothetical protein